ncbi:MAG: M23 family metallopeptidase [Eubacteriales bacterium]
MNLTSRQKIASGVVYAILAVIVISIVAVAVVSILNSGENAPDDLMENGVGYAAPIADEGYPDTPVKKDDNIASLESIPETAAPAETAPASASDTENAEQVIAEETEAAEIPASAETEAAEQSSYQIPAKAPTDFTLPCIGSIQKDYDADTLTYSLTMNDYRVHLGVDIASAALSPVMACAEGVISNIYADPFMGTTVVVEHGGTMKSYYMNLSPTLPEGIATGTHVEAGQVIAGVGQSSISESADSDHLHFELVMAGLRVDPCDYIPFESSGVLAYEDEAAS